MLPRSDEDDWSYQNSCFPLFLETKFDYIFLQCGNMSEFLLVLLASRTDIQHFQALSISTLWNFMNFISQ